MMFRSKGTPYARHEHMLSDIRDVGRRMSTEFHDQAAVDEVYRRLIGFKGTFGGFEEAAICAFFDVSFERELKKRGLLARWQKEFGCSGVYEWKGKHISKLRRKEVRAIESYLDAQGMAA